MLIYVQHSVLTPTDWRSLDSADWTLELFKAEPVDPIIIDEVEGWIAELMCQSLSMGGADHYAVEEITGGCKITSWIDGVEARAWSFLEPALDPSIGNHMNTRQTLEIWSQSAQRRQKYTAMMDHPDHNTVINVSRLNQFVEPSISLIRHGVNLPDALWDEHVSVIVRRKWEEWIT